MMHPEDHLAGYVDGTLTAKERAAVDVHVAGCDRCRHELALATAAHTALGSLDEVPAPKGVADAALAEAGLARASVAQGPPRWYRIAGVAAAAAAVGLVLFVVLPNPRGGDDLADRTTDSTGGAQVDGAAPEAARATALVVQDADYEADGLAALIAPYKEDQVSFAAADGRLATDAQTVRALTCLDQAAPDATGDLTQLIQARFQGTPAYLAVFLEGPGQGQPNDKGTVWVISRENCDILSFAQVRL